VSVSLRQRFNSSPPLSLALDSHDDEIRVLEAAVDLDKTVSRVVALIDAYQRAIAIIFQRGKFETDPSQQQDDSTMKEQNDLLLKLNYKYWLEYLWLKEESDFDFEKVSWLKTKNVCLSVCVCK
jgi:phage gp16-like protein